jgi:hypothetical protein
MELGKHVMSAGAHDHCVSEEECTSCRPAPLECLCTVMNWHRTNATWPRGVWHRWLLLLCSCGSKDAGFGLPKQLGQGSLLSCFRM